MPCDAFVRRERDVIAQRRRRDRADHVAFEDARPRRPSAVRYVRNLKGRSRGGRASASGSARRRLPRICCSEGSFVRSAVFCFFWLLRAACLCAMSIITWRRPAAVAPAAARGDERRLRATLLRLRIVVVRNAVEPDVGGSVRLADPHLHRVADRLS